MHVTCVKSLTNNFYIFISNLDQNSNGIDISATWVDQVLCCQRFVPVQFFILSVSFNFYMNIEEIKYIFNPWKIFLYLYFQWNMGKRTCVVFRQKCIWNYSWYCRSRRNWTNCCKKIESIQYDYNLYRSQKETGR